MGALNLTRANEGRQEMAAAINSAAGTNIFSCYQCGKCSAGCPISYAMDYQPRQIMRLLQLGLGDKALESSTIWLCASCQTCTTRCPREVDIAAVMDALRQKVVDEKRPVKERALLAFHRAFLEAIRTNGRLHEIEMVVRFKLKTGRLLQDLLLGAGMFLNGKLSILPVGIKGKKEIHEMFARAERLEEGSQ